MGTWSVNKSETYSIPGGSFIASMNFNTGDAPLVLGSNDTDSIISQFVTSNGTYVVTKVNVKTHILFLEPGNPADTTELLSQTKDAMTTSDRQQEINRVMNMRKRI